MLQVCLWSTFMTHLFFKKVVFGNITDKKFSLSKSYICWEIKSYSELLKTKKDSYWLKTLFWKALLHCVKFSCNKGLSLVTFNLHSSASNSEYSVNSDESLLFLFCFNMFIVFWEPLLDGVHLLFLMSHLYVLQENK